MADNRIVRLEALLRRDGPLTAARLAQGLGVSQPTVSRALAEAGDRIVRIGHARASRYALSREIARVGRHWPLYRIGAQAQTELLGELRALHGGGFHFEPVRPLPAFLHGEFTHGLFPGLPWFIDDQRPQGFLGRTFARRVADDIGASPDLLRWQSDDVVLALLRHGDDAPGDLVLGEAALQQALHDALSPSDTLFPEERETRYPLLADAALRGEIVGSSAGGEQPKFTAMLRHADGYEAAIVKFSERGDAPAARRWADLLVCERIAGDVLRTRGQPAAHGEILHADGRTFLQSRRFDRTSVPGRRGFVSLAALDAAFYGHGRIDWWRFAPQLQRDRWIDDKNARRLCVQGWFGALIGNTDMHLGNAGLILTDTRPLALAPAYDMLPMAFRPAASGEIVEREYVVTLPTPEQQPDWVLAASMAESFWRQVGESVAVSPAFHHIAEQAFHALSLARQRFGQSA